MLMQLSIINRGAGGCTPMIDPLDEKIASIRQRIRQFKKDYPELYESEKNEQMEPRRHTAREDFSKAEEFKRTLHAEKKSPSI